MLKKSTYGSTEDIEELITDLNSRGPQNLGDEVLVVSVNDFSFRWVKEKNIYAFPESSHRKVPDYMAFYRIAPLSAITHIGKVKKVTKGGKLNGRYRLIAFGDKARDKAIVVELGELKELDPPIKMVKNRVVQGAEYTTLGKLKNAKDLRDI